MGDRDPGAELCARDKMAGIGRGPRELQLPPGVLPSAQATAEDRQGHHEAAAGRTLKSPWDLTGGVLVVGAAAVESPVLTQPCSVGACVQGGLSPQPNVFGKLWPETSSMFVPSTAAPPGQSGSQACAARE